MSLLELKKNLRLLDDEALRELVGRLVAAEVAQNGRPTRLVLWGGAQTATDGGIDVAFEHDEEGFQGDFVPRAPTGIQVKKHTMGPAAIAGEMTQNGGLPANRNGRHRQQAR